MMNKNKKNVTKIYGTKDKVRGIGGASVEYTAGINIKNNSCKEGNNFDYDIKCHKYQHESD